MLVWDRTLLVLDTALFPHTETGKREACLLNQVPAHSAHTLTWRSVS